MHSQLYLPFHFLGPSSIHHSVFLGLPINTSFYIKIIKNGLIEWVLSLFISKSLIWMHVGVCYVMLMFFVAGNDGVVCLVVIMYRTHEIVSILF